MKNRIFFASDVHGSDRCFRKFINAGKFYGANILILGGDLVGKLIIPIIIQQDGTWKYNYGGSDYILKSQEELDQAVKSIKDSGYYPYLTNSKEIEQLSSDPKLVNDLFKKLAVESIKEWIKLAELRLSYTGIKCYISPGNDDFFEIDDALNSSSYIINPEEKVVNIDGEHEMITLGTTNHTPWNSPREVDEDILEQKIDKLALEVKNMNRTIFNIHVPPINTLIDQAPKVDKDLKPIIAGGDLVMYSAGSIAVRKSIEKYQPLAGLHGHIHEARGVVKIGRTACFNPGSEYNSGILKGLILDLEEDKIKSYLFTSG
ncbi:MAG: metallophosphoesterase family protein [Caldisphaera sp.]